MLNLKSFLCKDSKGSEEKQVHDTWYYETLEDCADGHWDWNVSKGDLYISRKLRELIGYSEEETKQSSVSWWLEKVHPEDQVEVNRKLEELTYSKSTFSYFDDFRFLCKNGDYIWLENHAKLLHDKDGKLTRVAGMAINITPQKYIHNQLYAIIADQEKNDQNRMRFLSNLSHEFRSPLSGIIGMTSLLAETVLTEEQRHFTDNISNSSSMLLALVNDILDVSKLNAGKFEFEKIRFSPFQVIKSGSDLIRPNIIKKNLTFNIFLSDDIPEYLIGDPTRLQQILVNLLGNAVKFTSKGSITLLVKKNPSTPEHQTTLIFEITDTGIGIAPDIQDNLFEDFTQANISINRIYGGTGLGLSICKELVHLMGGEIGVRSQPNRGSTFWFTIPLEEQETHYSAIESEKPKDTPEQVNHHRLKILLVEDNQVNQEVMQGLLMVLGDDVTTANNGQEAVDIFPTKKFDLVLMDLNMPILDGLQATQAIRKLPNGSIPIIAVTANTFTGEQANCLQHGITKVLNKPINKVTLEMALLPHRQQMSMPISKEERAMPQQSTPLPSTTIIVDQKTLHALINDLGKDKVIRLLDIYRKDALTLVSQLKKSTPLESNGYAHTLAGMSENLGIMLVGKTARDIMTASLKTPENLPLLIQDLERHFESSLTELEKVLC